MNNVVGGKSTQKLNRLEDEPRLTVSKIRRKPGLQAHRGKVFGQGSGILVVGVGGFNAPFFGLHKFRAVHYDCIVVGPRQQPGGLRRKGHIAVARHGQLIARSFL